MVGSEFVQKYLGEVRGLCGLSHHLQTTLGSILHAQGPRMVRDVFRMAKENQPSVVFIDEVSVIFNVARTIVHVRDDRPRLTGGCSGNQTVWLSNRSWPRSAANPSRTAKSNGWFRPGNQCQGGLDIYVFWHRRIIANPLQVIMATNRADTLDPALLRPGRLDRKVSATHRVCHVTTIQKIVKKQCLHNPTNCDADRISSARSAAETLNFSSMHRTNEFEWWCELGGLRRRIEKCQKACRALAFSLNTNWFHNRNYGLIVTRVLQTQMSHVPTLRTTWTVRIKLVALRYLLFVKKLVCKPSAITDTLSCLKILKKDTRKIPRNRMWILTSTSFSCSVHVFHSRNE